MNVNRESIITIQKELSNFIGCSGREEEVTDYLLLKLEQLDVDKAWIDPLGNVLAIKEGTDPDGLRILLDAHVDEVGFMITHIDDNGFIYITPLGGVDKRLMLGTLIQFQNENRERIIGVVGISSRHVTTPEEREKVPDITEMFVDIGCKTKEEVLERKLDIGSVGTFYIECLQLNEKILLGKAFDDRTGCNIILQVLESLKGEKIQNTLLINFAIQEEVGRRGATIGAYTLEPNIALAIENTTANDVPNVSLPKISTKIGEGPAITTADRSVIVPKTIIDRLKKAAEIDSIKWQYKKIVSGGTDAGSISLIKSGIPSGVISVPCRYIHANAGLINIEDIENTIKLVVNFCKI